MATKKPHPKDSKPQPKRTARQSAPARAALPPKQKPRPDATQRNAPQQNANEDLTDEDLAGIDEYENSAEGKAQGTPEPQNREKKLTALFYKTPEMQECRETADSININLNTDDTVAVQLNIPREFIRLTDFLEQKRALDAGVPPRPADKVLTQILLNELHDQLHALVTGPARFGYYRDLWNRFCDEHNAADLKLGEQPPQPPAEEF
jgi:hypothetical protein